MQIKTTILQVALVFSIIGCYKESIVTADEVIVNITGNNESIPADGVSKQLITVEIPQNTSDANNNVTITTTKGVFESNNKNSISVTAVNVVENNTHRKIAYLNLLSTTDTGTAVITASTKGYSKSIIVNFINAYPDKVNVMVDRIYYQINNINEVTVNVKISRLPGRGTPSENQKIVILAVDSSGNVNKTVGRFRNYTTLTDASGSCINYFSIPIDSIYIGKIKLIALATSNAIGTNISDTSTIISYK